ncbi:type II toxin-antitoxin system RelE/ParE family toxin [Zwartia sp.]|uniref:type II toxin-antitoxin system RelE/ParE family toxin n=1 Tax=Zwartia sp. TaxID=2978004 RepID=UPI003BB08E51
MYRIIETEQFFEWLISLKDRRTRARLQLRLRKASIGNLGDHKSVGDNVWEMREVFGPGWRMYYILHESTVIMMLGGGSKSSQNKDIQLAKALAQELRNEQDQNTSI